MGNIRDQAWILQTNETRRRFSSATWVPLRASESHVVGDSTDVDYWSEYFGCGSVAFLPEHRDLAESFDWNSIGISNEALPSAYDDGHYSPIDEYEHYDQKPAGTHLVFEHPQPVVGGTQWILNPDLVVALRLIKEGSQWVRPEENFVVVAREHFDEQGNHIKIEIKREFLVDYLAARNMSLRLSCYRQRVVNVDVFESSPYAGLKSHQGQRDGGKYELLVRDLDSVFGGSWATFRVWRNDIDTEDDAPVLGAGSDENTEYERAEGFTAGLKGTRVEGEFWRDEWIDHQGQSKRVRRDKEDSLPQFIVETDGTRLPSAGLNDEDVGRWLWFSPSVVHQLIGLRGFSLDWYTAQTGCIRSTSGYVTHFGLNAADLVTVYARDVARLRSWEQKIWAAHNVVPEGGVSGELLDSQVATSPASTYAAEQNFFDVMKMLEAAFSRKFKIDLFSTELDSMEYARTICRFVSEDKSSLLRLAKDLVRAFSDRLNVCELRKISNRADAKTLGSIKLLESILAEKVGEHEARDVFGVIVGVYDLRLGDAHPTGTKTDQAFQLARVDRNQSFLRQGEQLIANYSESICRLGKRLFY